MSTHVQLPFSREKKSCGDPVIQRCSHLQDIHVSLHEVAKLLWHVQKTTEPKTVVSLETPRGTDSVTLLCETITSALSNVHGMALHDGGISGQQEPCSRSRRKKVRDTDEGKRSGKMGGGGAKGGKGAQGRQEKRFQKKAEEDEEGGRGILERCNVRHVDVLDSHVCTTSCAMKARKTAPD